MRWFDTYKLKGYRVEHRGVWAAADSETRLVADAKAKPLWARFYDLERCEPYVCDRDGIPRRHLEQIGSERRNGYAWYSTNPASLFPLYHQWAQRFDPANEVPVSLDTPGANENMKMVRSIGSGNLMSVQNCLMPSSTPVIAFSWPSNARQSTQ